MGNPKSLSDADPSFIQRVGLDIYIAIGTSLLEELKHVLPHRSKSIGKDIVTFTSRTNAEGVSFLTKVLPKLGKALERSLETGSFAAVPGFTQEKAWNVPRFLGGVFRELFDQSGHLRSAISPLIIQRLRNFLLFWYKLEIPYSKEQEEQVVQSFIENDRSLALVDLDSPRAFGLLPIARDQISQILSGFDPRDIIPRHGPGAVSTGERGDQKWSFRRVFYDIHQCYPFDEYFVVGGKKEVTDRHDWRSTLDRTESGTAKVCLVPKDSRGPRLISCEPLEYQWIQQGLGRKLMDHLETHAFTRGHVNFTDQGVNRRLALISSENGQFATLDLKDASDMVSCALVNRLFPDDILRFMYACRTPATRLPDGTVLTLNKFAPMGSCLCFPVEALVFYAIGVAGIVRDFGVSPRDAREALYVYGDDIVVSTPYAHAVISALEDVGLVVNHSKCFIRGDFRESCGMDAYRGLSVTISRMRHPMLREQCVTELPALIALYNQLASAGMNIAAKEVLKITESRWGKVPYSTRDTGTVLRFDSNGREVRSLLRAVFLNEEKGIKVSVCSSLDVPYVEWFSLKDRANQTTLDSWPRLLRNLVVPGIDRPHLTTVRGTVKIRKTKIRLS